MSLRKLFKDAVKQLHERDIMFAVVGGFAADLYRKEARLTMDIDFGILVGSHAKNIAVEVLESIGLNAAVSRKADLEGGPMFAIRKKSTPPCIVVGRTEIEGNEEGVDILLPSIPWIRKAVERAQANKVDFGFGKVPALTLEDVVIAKLYALPRLRAKDLDDLQSIYEAGHPLDEAYLTGQIQALNIMLPKAAAPLIPDSLKTLFRGRRS